MTKTSFTCPNCNNTIPHDFYAIHSNFCPGNEDLGGIEKDIQNLGKKFARDISSALEPYIRKENQVIIDRDLLLELKKDSEALLESGGMEKYDKELRERIKKVEETIARAN